jgi:hypothetical protein
VQLINAIEQEQWEFVQFSVALYINSDAPGIQQPVSDSEITAPKLIVSRARNLSVDFVSD